MLTKVYNKEGSNSRGVTVPTPWQFCGLGYFEMTATVVSSKAIYFASGDTAQPPQLEQVLNLIASTCQC